MKNMVLVTHADFARGILTSLDLVLGQVGARGLREHHGKGNNT